MRIRSKKTVKAPKSKDKPQPMSEKDTHKDTHQFNNPVLLHSTLELFNKFSITHWQKSSLEGSQQEKPEEQYSKAHTELWFPLVRKR